MSECASTHECDLPPALAPGESISCPDCGKRWTSHYIRDMEGGQLFIDKGLVAADSLGWQHVKKAE